MQLFFKKSWLFLYILLFSFGNVVLFTHLSAEICLYKLIIPFLLEVNFLNYYYFIFCIIEPYLIMVVFYVIYSLTNESLLIGPELLVLGLFFILISAVSLLGADSINKSLLNTTKGFYKMGFVSISVISGLAKTIVYFFHVSQKLWLNRQMTYSRNATFLKIVENYLNFSKYWVKGNNKG